jgi:hypothetical protein
MKDHIHALACALTLTNYAVLKRCSQHEYNLMYTKLASLFLQMLIIFGLSTLAFSYVFENISYTYFCSAILAVSIYTLDKYAIASDLKIDNDIVHEKWTKKLKRIALYSIRVAFSCVFALFLGTAAELRLEKSYLDKELDKQHMQMNQAVINSAEQYRKDKTVERQQLITQHSNKMNSVNSSIVNARATKAKLEKKVTKRLAKVEYHSTEAILEEKRRGGCKEICESHQLTAANLSRSITQYQVKVTKLDNEIAALKVELINYDKKLEQANNINVIALVNEFKQSKLDQTVKAQTPGPLDYYVALQNLYEDEKVGSAAFAFSWLIKLVLITLELMPLVIHMLFTRPTDYQTKCYFEEKNKTLKAVREFSASTQLAKSESSVKPTLVSIVRRDAKDL